jgi:hypothetical protein
MNAHQDQTDHCSLVLNQIAMSPPGVRQHLEPPEGVSREMHAVNLCLSVISLRVHANMRRFHTDDPDIRAARTTATQLVECVSQLETLVGRLNQVRVL